MKKIITLLIALLMTVVMAGCQKQITASINYSDMNENGGGMQAEMPAKSTLKDLFDELGKGTDFTYELDADGYITTICGRGNDELGYWEITLNGDPIDDTIGNIAIKEGDNCNIAYIPNQDNAIVGGWEVAEVGRTEFEADEEEMFKKAMEVVLGETYEPVCVLATQLVSGMNYAFLARGTTVTETPVSNFFVVTIYKDLEGNASLKGISEINLSDIHTRADVDENILGGWEVRDSGKPGSLGSAEAQASFDKALEKNIGVGYNPIQMLATQLVAGTNYKALARGSAMAVDDKPELYVMTWYEDLDGNSQFTDIQKFDLNYYISE
ncbi:MAG: hypothetical protein IJI92_00975 [Erysipelotrichaceae bacterium]|nr:hypothetical protein [Erysipelotrichaceae bacterium]